MITLGDLALSDHERLSLTMITRCPEPLPGAQSRLDRSINNDHGPREPLGQNSARNSPAVSSADGSGPCTLDSPGIPNGLKRPGNALTTPCGWRGRRTYAARLRL